MSNPSPKSTKTSVLWLLSVCILKLSLMSFFSDSLDTESSFILQYWHTPFTFTSVALGHALTFALEGLGNPRGYQWPPKLSSPVLGEFTDFSSPFVERKISM